MPQFSKIFLPPNMSFATLRRKEKKNMARKIEIDPITRIEGRFAVKLELEDGKVGKAYSSGEIFRGFEVLLKGRHPMDAQQITQRICGVCPVMKENI